MADLTITGRVIEMGNLEGFDTEVPGIRIAYGVQVIVVYGLTRDQVRGMSNLMFRDVTLTLARTDEQAGGGCVG